LQWSFKNTYYWSSKTFRIASWAFWSYKKNLHCRWLDKMLIPNLWYPFYPKKKGALPLATKGCAKCLSRHGGSQYLRSAT
jgi:hypothetical protein